MMTDVTATATSSGKRTPSAFRRLRAGLFALLMAVLVALAGCSPSLPDVPLAVTGDPLPGGFGTPHTLDAAGGDVARGTVIVRAGAGAVPDGHTIEVAVGDPLGEVTSPFAGERYGQPVRVEHDAALDAPLTVTWDVSNLTQVQRHSMAVVRWDEAEQVWTPSGEPIVFEGDSAHVQVRNFSTISWVAFSQWVAENVTQNVGKVLDKRVDAPHCTSDPLPAWVSAQGRPDENLTAVALRTCFEPDVDNRLTLRVANNRSFAQRFEHRAGGQSWAWTWAGQTDFSPEGIVYATAREVVGSGTSVFLPPTHEVAVGFSRPPQPGSHHVELASEVDGVTMSTDLVAHVFGAQPAGGLDNPVLNAFVQVLLECGGRQLLSQPELTDLAQLLNTSVRAVKSCSSEILRGDSDFGRAFEEMSRTLVAKGGASSALAVQANRMVRQVANVLAVLEVADYSWYVSDQLGESLVGSTLVFFNASGSPGKLGDWTPTCRDTAQDSDQLYRNLALQDEFADKSRELWEFANWESSSRAAVQPLTACTASYRSSLADLVPADWADRRAAGIVADAIRNLTSASGPAERTGPGEYTVRLTHPIWGPIRLITREKVPAPGPASITVLDSDAKVKFSYRNEFMYSLKPSGLDAVASEYGSSHSTPSAPIDAQGNIFIDFNPGRYNGVIVLRPAAGGLEDFGTLPPPPDGYRTDFYYAAVVDANGDGTYEIEKFSNDCTPSCATGRLTSVLHRWTGRGFAP